MSRARRQFEREEAEAARLAEEAAREAEAGGEAGVPDCALCGRPIPPHARQSVHHLVPKLKGGRRGPTVLLHQICHNEIHATLTEAQLARDYDTPDKLRAEPHLAKFIEWLEGKPDDFHARSQRPERRR